MFNLSPTRCSPEVLRKSLLVMALSSLLFTVGCSSSDTTDTGNDGDDTDITDTSGDDTENEVADANFEATDWTEATRSKSADPDFEEVFDDTQVKRLDFVVTEARWQSMLDDMTATYGEFGGPQCQDRCRLS